jgi:uncharacterized protein YbjT (DUF2867 family)
LRILLIGASGFIGRHLSRRLVEAGHEVLPASRAPARTGALTIDLARDTRPEDWLPRLRGVDAVVNAAGIFRQAGQSRFAGVHEAGPKALFAACAQAAVRVVIQISALGADAAARSGFHLSKRSADDALRATALEWAIVQPSIVYGYEGESARQLALLAALPLVPLPGDGFQRLQPVHVEDLGSVVLRLLEPAQARRITVAAVGPRAVSVRDWLATLRTGMGLPAGRFIRVPLPLVRAVVGREAVDMLARGNTAPADCMAELLGRSPRDPADFIAGEAEGEALRSRARLDWLLPLLRAAVALTWIATGIVSLGVYPVADSLALLARVGLTGAAASIALFASALLDLALGVAIYGLRRHRAWLWRAQLALIAGYSTIVALWLPEYWLHPFGPLLKNLPLMAAILLLHEFEPRA